MYKRAIGCFALGVVALAIACANGGGKDPTGTPPAIPEGHGQVEGVVLAQNGQPLDSVAVGAHTLVGDECPASVAGGEYADDSGRYSFVARSTNLCGGNVSVHLGASQRLPNGNIEKVADSILVTIKMAPLDEPPPLNQMDTIWVTIP